MNRTTLYIYNATINDEKDIPVDIIVNDLQDQIDSDIYKNFNNIKIDNIEYKSFIKNKDVKISYFETQQLNSRNNLDIIDFSWQLPNNNPNLLDDNSNYVIQHTPSFSSNYENILISDKYTTDRNSNLIPLWYKHKSSKIKKVTKYERFKSKYDVSEQQDNYNIENGILYTNNKNTYDYNNDSYCFYIVTGLDNAGAVHSELLNVVPIFNEASWEDIYYNDSNLNDPLNGSFKNDVYSKEEAVNKWNYNLYFVDGFTSRTCNNGINGFFWKPEVDRFIKLKKPSSIYSYDPWHIRIQSSSVYETYGDKFLKYSVPEYKKQPFNPIFPCVKQNEKNCIRVTANIIKLPSERIKHQPDQNINLDIILFDNEENAYEAYTTDITKNDKLYSKVKNQDIRYKYGAVKSIDESNGFIEVNINLLNAEIVKCSYFEEVVDFVYVNYDLNPVNNKNLENCKIAYYLKPIDVKENSNDSNWRSIEHIVIDKNDKIIFNSNYNSLSHLLNLNQTSYIDFLSDFTTISQNDYQYLLLGEIFYKDYSKIDDCFSFDVRNTENIIEPREEVYKKNYKLQLSKYGFGNEGMPIQLNDLLYLSLPKAIIGLEENEFNKKFYLDTSLNISNIKMSNEPDLNFRVVYSFSDSIIFRFDIISTGIYTISTDTGGSLLTFNFNNLTYQKYHDCIIQRVQLNNSQKVKIIYEPDITSGYNSTIDHELEILNWS